MKELYRIRKDDLRRAGEVLADAFRDDPVWSRVFECVSNRETKLASFFEIPVRFCRTYGEAYASSPALEGAAAWVPGDKADMTFWRILRSGGMVPGFSLGADLQKRIQPVFDPLEKDRRAHMQGRRYVYLQVIGVAPEHQGRGFGGKLLRALLANVDASGIPVYLETQTEKNVLMYEKFDFETVKEIRLPVIGLPSWEMVREPV